MTLLLLISLLLTGGPAVGQRETLAESSSPGDTIKIDCSCDQYQAAAEREFLERKKAEQKSGRLPAVYRDSGNREKNRRLGRWHWPLKTLKTPKRFWRNGTDRCYSFS